MLYGGYDETIKGFTTQLLHLGIPGPSVLNDRKFRLFLPWVHPSTIYIIKCGVFC